MEIIVREFASVLTFYNFLPPVFLRKYNFTGFNTPKGRFLVIYYNILSIEATLTVSLQLKKVTTFMQKKRTTAKVKMVPSRELVDFHFSGYTLL